MVLTLIIGVVLVFLFSALGLIVAIRKVKQLAVEFREEFEIYKAEIDSDFDLMQR